MATTVSISSNYAGEAGAILGASFKDIDAISKGLVTLYPNVRYKLNLRKVVDTVSGKENYTCGHTPAGTTTLTEKVMTLKDIKADFSICKNDFKQTWEGLDDEMLDAIVAEKLAHVVEELGAEIWQGLAATAGEIQGFLVQFNADAAVIKGGTGEVITSIAAAVTSSTVVAELTKVVNVVPVAIRTKADLQMIVSPDVAEAYSQAQFTAGISNGFGGEAMPLKFGRYTLVEDAGLTTSTIVVARKSNLIVALDKQASINEVSVVDEDDFGRLSGNVIGKIAYSMVTGYYNGAEIVYYDTTEAQV